MPVFQHLQDSFSELFKLYWLILLVKNVLDAFISSSDSLGLVFNHSSWRVGLEKWWSIFINPSDQQSHTVGPRHWFLLWGRITLSEIESQIWHWLGKSLDVDRLQVGKPMVEGLYSGMLNQWFGIGNDPACCHCDVTVNLKDLFDAARHDKCWVQSPFNSQDHPFFNLDAHCWRPKLYWVLMIPW